MARQRFNGLKASLSGAHTAATTTLTFASALTYNNGVAVPSLTGTDYFMLTVLSSTGDLAEIVKVSAYTQGATTATVSRGESGTTAIAHASGATVVNAPTSGDYQTVLFNRRTAGDLSFNSTGWQDVSTSLDMTLPAQVGDTIEYSASFLVQSAANALAIDVATIVGGSPVNYFGASGGATDNGVMAWYCPSSVTVPVGGSTFYVLQAGDISGGNVTLRLRIRPANTTSRSISASAVNPLMVAVRNCR